MSVPQDHEVPLPFIRPKRFVERDNERMVFAIPVYLDADHPTDKTKVPIKIYSGGDQEDVEAFFITFFEYVNAMKKKDLWKISTFTQGTDVTSRINYFENTLDGNALSDWQAVRSSRRALTPANSSIDTWRVFKEDVAVFIVQKVCKGFQDPFTNQRKYMRGRKLCHGLKVREQYERVQFTNNCLPMLLTRETMETKSQGTAKTFSELWTWGSLQPHDMPEVITNMIPETWRQTYNVLAGGRDLDSEEMIRLLTTIENNPRFANGVGDNRRQPAQWRGGRRQDYGRSGRTYLQGRAPIQQYYPTRSQYRPRDETTQRSEAPLARERNTHGQQQAYTSYRGSPSFRRGGGGRFGAGRGTYQQARQGSAGRFDRSARPSREQLHHYASVAEQRPRDEHYAQDDDTFYDAVAQEPTTVQDAQEELEEQYAQEERQLAWEQENWRRFDYEQQQVEQRFVEQYDDEQFLTEEDEWYQLPSEDDQYDEGKYF